MNPPDPGPSSRVGSKDIWEAELSRLTEILITDPLPNHRMDAAEELASFSGKAPLRAELVSELLARSLRSDGHGSVRSAAARALGTVDDVSVMEPLAGAVTSDVAASVRISAIFALAETGREGAIAGISSALVDQDRVVRATAEKVLADLGAEIIPLENGGKLVRQGDEMRAIAVGVSTARVSEPPHNPVFRIHGAGGTRYLRTGVGDIYVNGSWLQSPPVEIPYQHDRDAQNLVHRVLPTYLGDVPNQNPHSGTAWLAWPGNEFRSQLGTDRITVAPVSPSDSVPAGVWPTSLNTKYIFSTGYYRPFSATFRRDTSGPEHSRLTEKWSFESGRLTEAEPIGDHYFKQLPYNLPSRVRDMASEVTRGHATPYLKAKAIEAFLREYYTYAFASPDDDKPLSVGTRLTGSRSSNAGAPARSSAAPLPSWLGRPASPQAWCPAGWSVHRTIGRPYVPTRLTSGLRWLLTD